MKECRKCLTTKPLDQFKPKRNWCSSCWSIRHKAYMKRPEQLAKARKRNYNWQSRYVRCRRSAELRGIPFELTREEYKTLCYLPCFYCGYATKDTGHGLDRKDSKQGYRLDNLVPACAQCNWAKNGSFTFEEAIELGKTIKMIRDRRLNNTEGKESLAPER